MKDEIKEILSNDNIHIIECDKNWCNTYGYEKSQLKEDLLNYITNLQKENERLKRLAEKDYTELNNIIYENYHLRNEVGKLNNIIYEIKEYIMSNLITEWDIKNNGNISGSDLPADAITPILDIINGDIDE